MIARKEISGDGEVGIITQHRTPATTASQRSRSGYNGRSLHQNPSTDGFTDHMDTTAECPSLQTMDQVISHALHTQIPRSRTLPAPPSQPFNQYQPPVHLPQPSHFANLAKSYCTSTVLIPSRSMTAQKQHTTSEIHNAPMDRDLIVPDMPGGGPENHEVGEEVQVQAMTSIDSPFTLKHSHSGNLINSKDLKKSPSRRVANAPQQPLAAGPGCIQIDGNKDGRSHKEASGIKTRAVAKKWAKFMKQPIRNPGDPPTYDTTSRKQIPGQFDMIADGDISNQKDEKSSNGIVSKSSSGWIVVELWKWGYCCALWSRSLLLFTDRCR